MSNTCAFRGCPKPPHYKHGNYCRYHHRKLVASGHFRMRPIGLVRAHVDKLRANGWTPQQIDEYAGLTVGTTNRIIYSKQEKVKKPTAEAIFSVPVVDRVSRKTYDATIAQRQVDALCYMGWSQVRQFELAGLNPGAMQSVRRGRAAKTTLVAIDELYRKLCLRQGPDRKTATNARTRGLASPLMWSNIYDPNEPYPTYEVPKPKREPRRTTKSHAGWKKGVAWDEVPFLRSYGYSDEEIANRIGVKVQTLRARFPRECVRRGCSNPQSTKSNVCRDHLL